MRRWEKVVRPALTFAATLAIWHAAVRWSGSSVFPSPAQVARGFVELGHKGVLVGYTRDSLSRVALGYLAAVLAAIPAGLLFGWWPVVGDAFNPVIQMIRPISPLAWIPVAIIWFGVGWLAPVFLIFLASFFPILISTMAGVRGVSPMFTQAGSNFGLSPAALVRRVVFPAALPQILVGLRIALGVAWLVVVAAEMIAVDSGLGYLIIDSRNAGKRYDLVLAGMLLIGAIGLILDFLICRLERINAIRWGFSHD